MSSSPPAEAGPGGASADWAEAGAGTSPAQDGPAQDGPAQDGPAQDGPAQDATGPHDTTAAPVPGSPEGPRGRPLSLRAQLLMVLVGVVTVLCAAIGVVSTVALHRFQLAQRDEQLQAAAERARRPPPGPRPGPAGTPGPAADFPRGQQLGTLMAFVVDGRIDFVQVHGPEQDEELSQAARDVLAKVPIDARPRTVDVPGLGDYRVVGVRAAPEYTLADSIITGLPLDDLFETRQQFIGIELVVGLLAVVVAVGAGTVLIRLTLRPLNRVAATARRVAELPLARGQVSLADRVPPADADPRTEVGQVGAAVNRMLGHVGDALAIRHASEVQLRQFIADASHELRTPLTAIRGYIELTRRRRDTASPEMTYAIERVASAAERMSTLVEDLLLLARLDAGRPLRRAEVDLSALVVEATSDAHVAGPGHRWTLDLPADALTVLGDRERLHQVLANLLTNARVHTPPGTTVTVGLAVNGQEAVLRVADDGPGIPDELRRQVFERFARGDTSRSRKAGSSGLGLAIVASVITAHHGTVEVCSTPGRTMFTVRLPRA